MSTTPNLLISHVAASQDQKETTANAGFDGLDEALCSNTSVAMSDADYTFATGAGSLGLSNIVFVFTGTLSANRRVVLPPNAKLYIVKNGSTAGGSPSAFRSLIFKAGTGASTVTVGDGLYHLIYCDGGNNVYSIAVLGSDITGLDASAITTGTISSALLPAQSAPIHVFKEGAPTNSEVIFRIPMDAEFTFPLDMSTSKASALVAATGTVACSIQKNGVEFATVTFAGGSTGTYATDSSPLTAIIFNPGDILEIVAPASADATLAGIGFSLVGSRAY